MRRLPLHIDMSTVVCRRCRIHWFKERKVGKESKLVCGNGHPYEGRRAGKVINGVLG